MHSVHVRGRRAALGVALIATVAAGAGGLAIPQAGAQHALRGASARERSALSTTSSAAFAAGWLGRQFTSVGDLPKTAGEPGLDYVPLAIVALASAKVGSNEIRTGIHYLKRHFESFVEIPESSTKTVASPGRLAQVILAAVAAKADPRHFGGDLAANNLVQRLLATETESGADNGLFGSPNAPTYSTAYTQGLALTALAAAGAPNSAGAEWLVRQQCSDGGWEGYRSTTAACPAPDPTTYAGPDTNDTALAVEGLVATNVSPTVSPVSFIKQSQYATGGFAYMGGRSSAQAPDPDSTAVVAQALVALGRLSSVTRNGKTVENGLARFRLGCGAPAAERGAYRYPGQAGANLYATIQAIPAAARKAYPIAAATASSALPTMSCA